MPKFSQKEGKQVRLDGWTNGKSNCDIEGRFQHQNRTWEVHGDRDLGFTFLRILSAKPIE